MRKWKRERLQRRKQKSQAEKPASQPTQEPLQPTYYEAQEPEPVTAPEPEERGKLEEGTRAASESSSAPQAESSSSRSDDRPRRRRRRGRGGRGRGSAKPAAPLQPTLMREAEPAAERAEAEPVPAAPTQAEPATPAKPKGVVVLAIGLPGSGKSSWFKRHNIRPLSSDLLRELLFDDPTEQRFQDLVFSNLRSMLKARLIARRPMNYVDATNLSPHERHTWIKMAHDYVHRMSAKLRAPKFEEGFSKITVVRVKKKD
jgi:hypothetical protein